MLGHSKAAAVLVLGLVGFAAFANTAEAVPIRVRMTPGGGMARIMDVNWDQMQGGGYQTSLESLGLGTRVPASESGSGSYEYDTGISIGFGIPRADELADPLRGEWHRDNSPDDVVIRTTGHVSLSWGGFPYRQGASLTAQFTPDSKVEYRVDPSSLPPDLLNLLRHPERISISGGSGWQTGGYGSGVGIGFTSLPASVPTPAPVPEPAALTTFGLILGGLLWHRRRGRSGESERA